MYSMKKKITKNSKRVVYFLYGLLVITGLIGLLIPGELQTTFNMLREDIEHESALSAWINDLYMLFVYVLVIAILVLMIYMFRTISKNGSPFVKNIPTIMKIIAGLLLFNFVINRLVLQIVFNVLVGRSFYLVSVIDNQNTMGAILTAVVYCFALFFEYGCALQTENDEIL